MATPKPLWHKGCAKDAKFLRKMNFEISLIDIPLTEGDGRKPHCDSALLPNMEQLFQYGSRNGSSETRSGTRFFYICFQKVHILYV